MERLLFLDAIKAFAILLVIFVHMQNFLSAVVTTNYLLFEILKFIALACFTFASGYAIYANNTTLGNRKEILHFYKKRIVRIYPLYLAALFVYFLCFQVLGLFHAIHYTVLEWVANICCLQVVLAPAYIEPIFTLWFIGFIMMLYAMYPLFSRRSDRMGKRLVLAVGIFGVLAVLHLFLNIIDYRFFLYYFFFIAGIAAAEENYRFSRVERSLKNHKNVVVQVIGALAYASYCVYLFHMPIFAVSGQFISGLTLSSSLQNGVVLFLVIPIIFCLCYCIQRLYDAGLKNRLIGVRQI